MIAAIGGSPGATPGTSGTGLSVPVGGAGGATPARAARGASLSADQDDGTRLRELRQADAEVRAHEQAHVAAGGHYVSGARYETVNGPDNRQYAVSGEVGIDVAPVPGNPEATLEKARTVRRAALAPAQPSGKDMQVAAQAAQMEAQARMDKAQDQSRGAEARLQPAALDFEDDLERGTPRTPPRHAVQAYARASGDPPPRHGDFASLA